MPPTRARAREQDETGVNIGAPVAATNPESIPPHNEKVTYWLSGANASACW